MGYEDIIAQNQQDISDLEKKLKDTEAAKLKHELETKSLQDVADMEKILKDYEKLTHAAQNEAEESRKLVKDRDDTISKLKHDIDNLEKTMKDMSFEDNKTLT